MVIQNVRPAHPFAIEQAAQPLHDLRFETRDIEGLDGNGNSRETASDPLQKFFDACVELQKRSDVLLPTTDSGETASGSRVFCSLVRPFFITHRRYNMTSLVRKSAIVLVAGFIVSSAAEAAFINFDSLPGMFNSPGSTVPTESRLSNSFLSMFGVSFSSSTDYVAVVNHSPYPTVSTPNVIGGVTVDGRLSYGMPIEFTFFDPANSTTIGVTNFVSIRGEQAPLFGATATMEAFDILGNSLGSTTASDSTDGLTLSLAFEGIHSIRLTQNSAGFGYDGTIGFDNLSFNTVTAVPVPAAVWLFTSGLLVLAGGRLRSRPRTHA